MLARGGPVPPPPAGRYGDRGAPRRRSPRHGKLGAFSAPPGPAPSPLLAPRRSRPPRSNAGAEAAAGAGRDRRAMVTAGGQSPPAVQRLRDTSRTGPPAAPAPLSPPSPSGNAAGSPRGPACARAGAANGPLSRGRMAGGWAEPFRRDSPLRRRWIGPALAPPLPDSANDSEGRAAQGGGVRAGRRAGPGRGGPPGPPRPSRPTGRRRRRRRTAESNRPARLEAGPRRPSGRSPFSVQAPGLPVAEACGRGWRACLRVRPSKSRSRVAAEGTWLVLARGRRTVRCGASRACAEPAGRRPPRRPEPAQPARQGSAPGLTRCRVWLHPVNR